MECDSVDTVGVDRTIYVDVTALETAVNKAGADTIVMMIAGEKDYLTLDCSPVWWTIAPFIKENANAASQD